MNRQDPGSVVSPCGRAVADCPESRRFAGTDDSPPFATVAAMLIGGTCPLGRRGGSRLSVLILTALQAGLSGSSLSQAEQEAIFGSAIVPAVALRACSPHSRMQISGQA